MGFGYLLIGYLTAFVLAVTANAIQIGSLVLLLGYLLMFWGIRNLRHYCSSFLWALITVGGLAATAVWKLLADAAVWFSLSWDPAGGIAGSVLTWIQFALAMLFHAALLSAVRELALSVELPKTAQAAVRNSVLVLIYGILYLTVNLPISGNVNKYLTLSMNLFLIVYVACNLFLFLSCTKDICPAGEETPEPKTYRWKWLNRVGESYAKTQRGAIDRSRQDVEHLLQKKRQKQDAKRQAEEAGRVHHKKKKK